DRVRARADGTWLFLERVDRQVKVRGFRIELGEIEAVLAGHPEVEDVAVQVGPTEGQLVAYLACAGGRAPGDLAPWARRVLPEYMVPTHFVVLDSLPRTSTGKIDRKALPEPVGASGGDRFVPAATETERVLCAVVGEVLGIERVGVEDDFFA